MPQTGLPSVLEGQFVGYFKDVGGKGVLDELPQGIKKGQAPGDDGHGGGLAAGDDEGVALGEFRGGADFEEGEFGGGGSGELGCGAAEEGRVLADAALEGEDADGEGGHLIWDVWGGDVDFWW